LGLLKLEPARHTLPNEHHQADWRNILRTLTSNKQARLFFIYLTLLLTAVLGQDVLLEPFGGEALNLSVAATTRLSSLYGVCFLLTLVLANPLERYTSKTRVAQIGSAAAIGAFSLLILGGLITSTPIFYGGVVLLGLAIGLATVSNHSLMLDMTTPQNVGLFIGAWGFATALARLFGSVMSGVVRDVVAYATQVDVLGYLVVFGLNIAILITSLYLLRRIDLERFQQDTREAFKMALE
jgi:BCD family chlorophyll transporter-like MFS transporter